MSHRREVYMSGDTIHLKTPQGSIQIDSQDYGRIIKSKAYVSATRRGKPPVTRAQITVDGKSSSLSRWIMSCPDDKVVDHVNHDPLDNRRANLRVCTPSENAKNKKKYKNSTNTYKGVVRASGGMFAAVFSTNGKPRRSAMLPTEEAAAWVYDMMALDNHGEFACTNSPKEELMPLLEEWRKVRPFFFDEPVPPEIANEPVPVGKVPRITEDKI